MTRRPTIDSICTICQESHDVLVACQTCRKHGWCLECDARLERCPLCRSGFAKEECEVSPVSAVRRIMNYRTAMDTESLVTIEYLVEWANGDRSWEPEDIMDLDIPHLIQAYWFGQSNQ